jgi:hypothetical protein
VSRGVSRADDDQALTDDGGVVKPTTIGESQRRAGRAKPLLGEVDHE